MNDVSALFEIFPICQKFLLNTIDIPSMDLTKTQILRSDENRKMVYVKLTEKGNQLILQEKALVKEYLSKRFESLSKEDQELFHQSLSNILTILKKME